MKRLRLSRFLSRPSRHPGDVYAAGSDMEDRGYPAGAGIWEEGKGMLCEGTRHSLLVHQAGVPTARREER